MNSKISRILPFFFICVFTSSALFSAPTVRIKDIAYIQGVRDSQLVGVGLVTGLNGKGDSSRSSLLGETLSTLLQSFGIEVPADEIKSKNCALVTVTAEVQSFVREGDRISVNISSIVDAKDLQGGVLLQTNLMGNDGEIYAVAQGVVPITEKTSNRTSTSLPGGAIMEKEIQTGYINENRVNIILRYPDFATAFEVAEKISEGLENVEAAALDASLVQVGIPEEYLEDPVRLISGLENIEVTPSIAGRVVINPKTGVVVIGENVRIGKVAVSYKGDSISIGGFYAKEKKEQFTFPEYTSLEDLVDVMQTVGLKSDVIIEILQAINRAGALFGELIMM